MAMQQLAPEILVHVFEALLSTSDIINLSLTCRYFHTLLPGSQRLVLFYKAIDQTMGPIEEITQLLTFNHNQPLHLRRDPPMSYALLRQVTTVGRVAQRFVKLYPMIKWAEEQSANRRLLRNDEARRLRRAIYRAWTYSQAFHSTPNHRIFRSDAMSADRLQLLRNWTTEELLELEDFRGVIEQLLASEICPTDGDVHSRHPEEYRAGIRSLHFPSHQSIDNKKMYEDTFHNSRHQFHQADENKITVQDLRFRSMQGWGSDLENFYLVQAFLKLTPAQILLLFDNAISKADVECFIESQTRDICFLESGSLLFHDWVTILHQRGIDVQQAREAIWDGQKGIAFN